MKFFVIFFFLLVNLFAQNITGIYNPPIETNFYLLEFHQLIPGNLTPEDTVKLYEGDTLTIRFWQPHYRVDRLIEYPDSLMRPYTEIFQDTIWNSPEIYEPYIAPPPYLNVLEPNSKIDFIEVMEGFFTVGEYEYFGETYDIVGQRSGKEQIICFEVLSRDITAPQKPLNLIIYP
jgi:hypothetical protein